VDPAHGISKRFQLRQKGKSYLLGKTNLRGGPIVSWPLAHYRNLGELGDSGAWGGCCWLGEVSRQTCGEWRQRKASFGALARQPQAAASAAAIPSAEMTESKPSAAAAKKAKLTDESAGTASVRPEKPTAKIAPTPPSANSGTRAGIYSGQNCFAETPKDAARFFPGDELAFRMSCRDVGILCRERRYWATPSAICAQSIFSVPLSLNTRP
jgi:hypothetical protein